MIASQRDAKLFILKGELPGKVIIGRRVNKIVDKSDRQKIIAAGRVWRSMLQQR